MTATVPMITLRPVDPARDAALIHGWVTEDRAAFWMMSDYSLADVQELYQWIADQPTHTASLFLADGEPAGIVQTYATDAEVEPISRILEHRAGDLGLHFFAAGGTRHRSGWTGRLVAAALAHVFADPAVDRIVLDPDVRNTKAVELVRRSGGVPGPVVDLGFKTAQLMYIARAQGAGTPVGLG